MEIKPKRSELKIESNVSKEESEILDLRTLDTNVIVKELEDTMKLRETPIDKRLLKKIL